MILGGQIIYGLSQLLVVLDRPVEFNLWTFIGIIIMIAGNFAFVHIMITNSMKTELEAQLREVSHIRELEQMHYASIEARRQEMAKIRHDLSNQLTAAHHLLLQSKGEFAEKLLAELEQSLDTAAEHVFCENAIVNAVLIEKKKECDGAEISLETDIAIPVICGISQSHLCSIFANLLDNAIRACTDMPIKQRKIEMRTAFIGEYLHIKCANPFAESPKKGKNGKGYGKIILADIAAHYGGCFTAEIADGTHIAVVSLLCDCD